jgi:transcription initiation factor TFIID subunit 6
LASLREDTAISGLLVYLVKWLSESINKCLTGALGTLGCLIDAVEAVLDNSGIFLEPYVRLAVFSPGLLADKQIHQLLAPLLSTILTVPLGPFPPSSSTPKPDAFDIRARAADVLGQIAQVYGPRYPGLVPREYMYLIKVLCMLMSHRNLIHRYASA